MARVKRKPYMMEVTDQITQLSKENWDGYVEYKRTLVNCTEECMHKYATQMKWRINQNPRKRKYAVYYIGINDNGTVYGLDKEEMNECIDMLMKIIDIINATIKFLLIIPTENNKFIIKAAIRGKSEPMFEF